MLRYISFGSGSSGNCSCLFDEDGGLMIDAGVGVRRLKKAFSDYGLSIARVHNILITHDHADHIQAVGRLSERQCLPVYASQLVHTGITENRYARKKVPAAMRHDIEPGVSFKLGRFEITPFRVPHDAHDNMGYLIGHDGVNFCLMTDVGHVTEEMGRMIAQADYLVIEANHDEEMLRTGPYPQVLKARITCGTGHLSNRLCGEALTKYLTPRTRHIWLCHLSQENNLPGVAESTVRQALCAKGFRVGDGLQIEVLPRTSVAGFYELA